MYQQKRSDNKRPQFIGPPSTRAQQQRQQSNKGMLNRTSQEASMSNSANNVSGIAQAADKNRSFNAPLMRHTSPSQMAVNAAQRQMQNAANVPHQQQQAVRLSTQISNSRGLTPQGSKNATQQPLPSQQQQQQLRQYQPSLMFKPGQAKQQFQYLQHGRSEPEIANNYHTEPQHQLNPVQMGYQQEAPNAPLQPPRQVRQYSQQMGVPSIRNQAQHQVQNPQKQQQNYMPQFNSNQSSYQTQKVARASAEGHTQMQMLRAPNSFEGAQAVGAENQHPYPRQYPIKRGVQAQQAQQLQQQQHLPGSKFTSPDSHQNQIRRSTDGLKSKQQLARSPQVEQRYSQQQQSTKLPVSTHQMKAYDTAPAAQQNTFYPPQSLVMPATGLEDSDEFELGVADQNAAAIVAPGRPGRHMRYLDMPRSSDPDTIPYNSEVIGEGEDDLQIREMENLLAEIGQDVSELKKRPFYKSKLQNSEPRSSSRKVYQNSKTSSLSPNTQNRSRSYHSGSQEGTHAANISSLNAVQHRSLSPQIGNGSNSAGPRKQASSQSRKHIKAAKNAVSQQSQPALVDSQQWASPNEHQRVSQSQAPQIANPTPSHTNTMSLTVSVNPDQNGQERLFRLSPLSSKMQEDTDGEEQSTSQRFFNLNQSINNSQLDSSSPDNLNHDMSNPGRRAQANLGRLAESNQNNNARTYEDADDDEEVKRIVAHMEDGQTSAQRQQQQLLQQSSSQPYSEDEPVLMSSALGASQVAVRTETPLASTDIRNDQATTRAFSRSSNRRGRSDDNIGLQYEGPARVPTKSSHCQTDEPKEKELSSLGMTQQKLVDTTDQETQTARRDFAPVQLSPFDTYDLFFVKDLVNNLNQDNEVLVDSNQDLKYAFHFLIQKHKQLQQQLTREQAKIALFEDTKKRLVEVTNERDKAIEHGMQLSQKILTMNRIVRLAVDEQAHLEQESELVMAQLQEENTMLRSLLKISQEYSAPVTQAALTSTIQEIEKKQQEMAYKADIKLREQIKAECELELEQIKKELPAKIEEELKVKYEYEAKQLSLDYEDKIAKHVEETAMLKKTLLEQSLQRLNQLQQHQSHDRASVDGSEESNSLEGSHGLHHFSNNSSERPAGSEQLQMSGSFSSSTKNNNSQSEVMQQELDDFAKIFHGDLTKEEQELVSQLTAQANKNQQLQQQSAVSAVNNYKSMDLDELRQSQNKRYSHNQTPINDPDQASPGTHGQQRQGEEMFEEDDSPDQLDRRYRAANQARSMADNQLNELDNENEDEEDGEMMGEDDYDDDFEQFGEEAKSPQDDRKLVKVVTNPKQQPQRRDEDSKYSQQSSKPVSSRDWDFDEDGYSENLFSSKAVSANQQPPHLHSVPTQKVSSSKHSEESTSPPEYNTDMMDEDYMADNSPLQSKMHSNQDSYKLTNDGKPKENVDLLADFNNGLQEDENDEQEEAGGNEDQAEILRQKYDEFFTSESDEIEDELIDGESSDSDSDHGGNISPKSFDAMVEKQKQNQQQLEKQKDLREQKQLFDANEKDEDDPSAGTAPSQKKQPKAAESPVTTSSYSKASDMGNQPEESNSSSERKNKYKRDKRASGGPNSDSQTTPPDSGEQKNQDSAKTSSFAEIENRDSLDFANEAIEFDPPHAATSSVISQDFAWNEDDFLYSESSGHNSDFLASSGGHVDSSSPAVRGAGGFDDIDWDDDGDDDEFFGAQSKLEAGPGTGRVIGGSRDNEGIDDEERRFFEELSKGLNAKDEDRPIMERNELMDDTRATRQMLAAQRQLEQARERNENSTADGDKGDDLDMGTIDFDTEREEAKEDEYDYFLDNQPEENPGTAQGYHIIDEADLQDSDEDLEELTEEEQAERQREMLKDLKERIDKEEAKQTRSPRHKPRM